VGGLDVPGADYSRLNNPVQLARVEGFLDRRPGHARIVTGGTRVGQPLRYQDAAQVRRPSGRW
jgi:betaine-aldehyde dehydrogenase